MKNSKMDHLVKYTSPILILSYFFIHNIILVLIGITFSLYIININYINSFIKSISNNLVIKNVSKELSKSNKESKYESNNKNMYKEDSSYTLVEAIEELGFIPSIHKTDEDKAA